jgi:hypothetical protein
LLHQRPAKRQREGSVVDEGEADIGFGHAISMAATMAAISSSFGSER